MQRWLILSLFISTSVLANCLDLSGTYEFKGVDRETCRLGNGKMHLSPLPLNSIIHPGSRVQIRQSGCESVDLIYSDDRYSNTRGIMASHQVDLKDAQLNEQGLSSREIDNDTVCYMVGCLSSADKTTWSLGLNEERNLAMTFRHRSVGVYNFIVPTIEIVRAKCVLERVED